MKAYRFIFVLLIGFLFYGCLTQTATDSEEVIASTSIFPRANGLLNDYGRLFIDSEFKELNKILNDYNDKTTRQIAVITIDSISPYQDIQKYATDLGNHWGVGMKDKDNGLIMLICNPCREISIVTGWETREILTDEICEEVIDQTIIPQFKEEKIYEGVKNGILELIDKWNKNN